jgi:hypothetical protein
MEIINALGGTAFALVLAAIAVSPNAISTYIELLKENNVSEPEV